MHDLYLSSIRYVAHPDGAIVMFLETMSFLKALYFCRQRHELLFTMTTNCVECSSSRPHRVTAKPIGLEIGSLETEGPPVDRVAATGRFLPRTAATGGYREGPMLTASQEINLIYARYDGPLPDEERARIRLLMNPPRGSRLASELRYAEVRVWCARKRAAKRMTDRIERDAEVSRVETWLYPAFSEWQRARQDELSMRSAAE